MIGYALIILVAGFALNTNGFASTAEFESEITAGKSGMKGVTLARTLLEDHRGPLDVTFSDYVATYISTGTLSEGKPKLSDKVATPEEMADFFRLFLAAAYRGETLSEIFSRRLNTCSDEKGKSHIRGAIELAKLAETAAQAGRYVEKEGQPFDVKSVFDEYSSYTKTIINPIREKDQAWRDALYAVPITRREEHGARLEDAFRQTRDKAKKTKDSTTLEDFEKAVVRTIYDNLDTNDDYSSFHPDMNHYMTTPQWPEILEEAKKCALTYASSLKDTETLWSIMNTIDRLHFFKVEKEREALGLPPMRLNPLNFFFVDYPPLLAADPLIIEVETFSYKWNKGTKITLQKTDAHIKFMKEKAEDIQKVIKAYEEKKKT